MEYINVVVTVINLLILGAGVYLNIRKAPHERKHLDAETFSEAANSSASVVKSYSEEIIKLRGQIEELQDQINQLENLLSTYQRGVEELMKQIKDMKGDPVWTPGK